MNSFDPKYIIDKFIIPRMDTFDARLEDIDHKLDEGTPWGQKEVERVNRDLRDIRTEQARLRTEHNELKSALLSPDTIADLVNKALQKAKARGWTNRERWMGVILFATAIGTLIINIINLKHHP